MIVGCWNCGERLDHIPASEETPAYCSELCRGSWNRRMRLYGELNVVPEVLKRHRALNAALRRNASVDLLGRIEAKQCQAVDCERPTERKRLCAQHAARIEEDAAAKIAAGRTE